MLFKTHAAFGMFIGFLIAYSFEYFPLVFLVCTIASLLPDIDSTKSFVGNRFYLRPIQWIAKHRGFFHSLTACTLLSIIIWNFLPTVAFAFFAGYASHLLIDSFTVEGITPFWPMKARISGAFTTGTFTETVIFYCLCIAIAMLVLWRMINWLG